MKRIKEAPHEDEETGLADHRASPEEVLETVDRQLADFGLEITLFESGTDSYLWKVTQK